MNLFLETSVMLVVSSLLLVWLKSIRTAIKILSLQSFFLGITGFLLAWETGEVDMYIMAILTIVVKAIVIPSILDSTMRKMYIKRETDKFIGREISLLSAAGLVVFSYVITKPLGVIMSDSGHPYLPNAISMLLIGLFVMITHKKAIMQGIGLIVIENGLFLFALSASGGMPFMVDIGIFLDVFVSVILISLLSYRMDQTFKSISTDWLRKLKG
ncbi:hydrogenase [Neobacillus sp. PS3-40]|uniref:hydrogenase n=1 Tax=Neobacillus sp. PS3-40 TaxID=3070679 RepID=UPI0027DEEADD|nr:hydrogenase [Neobacillus sp. PS3-40]WML44864.1 hydrogenase [Neobacillus sp. PS3-40]